MLKIIFNPYIVKNFSEKDLGTENIYKGIDVVSSGKFMGANTACDVS